MKQGKAGSGILTENRGISELCDQGAAAASLGLKTTQI